MYIKIVKLLIFVIYFLDVVKFYFLYLLWLWFFGDEVFLFGFGIRFIVIWNYSVEKGVFFIWVEL